MVLQQCSLFASNTARNVASLLGSKHDSVEGLVDFVIIMEGAGVLSDCIELAAKGAERSSVYGVRMARCIHIRASLVNGGVLRCKVSANVEPASRRSLIGMLEDGPTCFMQETNRVQSKQEQHTIANAAAFRRRFSPPSMTLPSSLTRMRSDALMRLKAVPKGFTQNVSGSTGSR